MNKKNLVILGATGSIGRSAAEVVKLHRDLFNVRAVVSGVSATNLAHIANELDAEEALLVNAPASTLKPLLKPGMRASSGETRMLELVSDPEVDIVLCGIVGTPGIKPVLAALTAGKTVALATKEVLVCAGKLVELLIKKHGGKIIPVDSEHSALYQCLEHRPPQSVKKLILTASGGAFRDWSKEKLAQADVKAALSHPTWNMGRKVTIDSATLMNKSLEIVEAHHLFHVGNDQLEVLIHRESIIHSLVEFCDNSLMAILSRPDMQLAIQYALCFPEIRQSNVPELDLARVAALHFEQPDMDRFPALKLGFEAIKMGGTAGVVMNAANEIAVDYFSAGRIAFGDICSIIEQAMEQHKMLDAEIFENIVEADRDGRALAEQAAMRIAQKHN